ncbi:MAG: TonB-dependent receptor [Magnetococcales bacterium]|nr:TonB-dependent receptor [Magnetococcales bacterium]
MNSSASHSAHRSMLLSGLALLLLPTPGWSSNDPQSQLQMEQLLNMEFKDLAEIRLTSVARREQKLVDTTAAVTVIDAEQIRRSGLTSLPELLRLVPGMNVARINASTWAISTRGFNAQYSNKLLVLMDGRTLYTPLFAGVFWNIQDYPLADIERIEVIRGPGATMWGANAVNGVINIITKKASQTQGNLLAAGVGTTDALQGNMRHGGQIGENLDYRIYARGFTHNDLELANGTGARDNWHSQRAGFRTDWRPNTRDEVSLQGDLFGIHENYATLTGDRSGGNLLTRWTRTLSDTSNWSLQLFYDRNVDSAFEQTSIYDLDWQYAFRHDQHALLWGVGYRMTTMELESNPIVRWNHPSRQDHYFSLFLQDEITFNPQWTLTVGTKVEHNDYTGVEWQPNARLLWRVADNHALWAAMSRAIRSPARVDADIGVISPFPLPPNPPVGIISLTGNPDSRSETLHAHELGYRAQIKPELSFELTGFYNRYDHVTTFEQQPPLPPPPLPTFPQSYGNLARAASYGLESALEWQVNDSWKLTASHTWFKMNIDLVNGSTDIATVDTANNAPRHQWQLHAYLDLPYDLQLDGALYHVDRLTSVTQQIPSYTRLDLRLGWRPTPGWNVSLAAQNLLDARHPEFTGTSVPTSEVSRAFLATMDWSF